MHFDRMHEKLVNRTSMMSLDAISEAVGGGAGCRKQILTISCRDPHRFVLCPNKAVVDCQETVRCSIRYETDARPLAAWGSAGAERTRTI
ncbi:hypothetical protein MPTK1_1g04900 [Marchantia polymorpha subsp. ruderalis]|uniref:Uncharacterized protein n=2 Tax=Marchantia polymorpha TaxID=3197 RepID=A0AAF6ALL2_MARPO|nr:hypothetical protein MARPO_0005s0118 [Marchantia polymorpha]BBM97332.1 hypothetical protein Mp_1g04900 [Marchantia polymorpha subsp. ruderalis]|eukprot:PTQ48475.1 hypothetical protein MARPO_0005s0118 [Marchantia polymorpha]